MTVTTAEAPRKRRRVRSQHPGVVLIKPEPGGKHPHWRARYADPDLRRRVKVTLGPMDGRTLETRRDWARRKADQLAERRAELERGAPRANGLALKEVLEKYFTGHLHLRARTLTDYRAAVRKLQAWASREGILTADCLTRSELYAFRELLIAEQKQRSDKTGPRGKKVSADGLRSAQTVNGELRRIRVVLSHLVDRDMFVRLSRDDIRRALKYLPMTYDRVAYLQPDELRQLLQAAFRHDEQVFSETRAEHAGSGRPGNTYRYEPIAPFVAIVLLTGMRFGEALTLDWSQVKLSAQDNGGRARGEIRLEGRVTKTRRGRTIVLEVSPALQRLLALMHLLGGGRGQVFVHTAAAAQAAAKRLRSEYGAPRTFSWQKLRRTCGTFLTNAPSIFGAASAFRSAAQLGHSVVIAERHYLALEREISPEARTLEAAMQIEAELAQLCARFRSVGNYTRLKEAQR